LPVELLRGPEILLCKVPPLNLDAMTDLKLIQISSVGYEHLRHLGLADRRCGCAMLAACRHGHR